MNKELILNLFKKPWNYIIQPREKSDIQDIYAFGGSIIFFLLTVPGLISAKSTFLVLVGLFVIVGCVLFMQKAVNTFIKSVKG